MILFTIILTACILTTVGAFSCWYISSMLTQKVIREYTVELEQIAIHLSYLQREIRQFATEIASDSVTQNALWEADGDPDITALIVKKKALAHNLRGYMTQKNCVIGIDLVFTDGWSASSDTMSTTGIIDSMNDRSWFDGFMAAGKTNAFLSSVEVTIGRNDPQLVMAYLLRCNNYLQNVANFATLIIYFQPEFLIAQIESVFASATYVALRAQDSSLLYTQGTAAQADQDAIELSTDQLENGWTLTVQLPKNSALHQVYYMIGLTIAGTAALFLLVVTLVIPMIGRWTRPVRQMTKAAQRIADGDLDYALVPSGKDEIGELSYAFSVMSRKLKQQIQQIKKDEQIRTELKVDLLMAKINPHFIYNTLNSAIFMAQMGRCEETAKLCRVLVRILQDTLHAKGEKAISTVDDELATVRDYVELQTYRYPNRFSIEYHIQPESRQAHLPCLTLQPLVENALFHGILVSETLGVIGISTALENDMLRVQVRDNGAGMTEQQCLELLSGKPTRPSVQMRSIGLSNIRDRLTLIYGGQARLLLESTPGKGTCVTLLLTPTSPETADVPSPAAETEEYP